MDVYEGVKGDVEFFRRRLSLIGKVLPIPLRLEPGEHLRDGVLRAIHENCGTSALAIARLSQSRSFKRLSAFKSIADTSEIERILDVLGLCLFNDEVQAVLRGPIAKGRAHVSFFGNNVLRAHITSWRRVSPRALRIRCFQRALWSIGPISFDVGTGELLVDHCPACSCRLDWSGTKGVAFCTQCNLDFRELSQPLIDVSDEEALRFVVATLDPLVSDDEFHRYKSPMIEFATRGQQFQLAVRIASSCGLTEAQTFETSRLSHRHVERAGRAILRWPDGVMELAEHISSQARAPLHEGAFARLQYDPTLCPKVQQELRKLFVRSKRQLALSLFREQRRKPALVGTEKLRHPRSKILGTIKSFAKPGGYVEGPTDIARDIKSVRDASRILGLSVPDILELFGEGFLTELIADLKGIGIDHKVSPSSVRFVEKLAHTPETRAGGLSLPACKFALDISFKSKWSRIFSAIADGSLEVLMSSSRVDLVTHSSVNVSPVLASVLCLAGEWMQSESRFRLKTLRSSPGSGVTIVGMGFL